MNHSQIHVVFHEADVLFTGSLEGLWNAQFDAAVTYRFDGQRPISLAVKYVKGVDGNLKAVAQVLLSLHQGNQQMWPPPVDSDSRSFGRCNGSNCDAMVCSCGGVRWQA